ncbi:small ribosomal subunit protein eS19A-like [Symsagittifera roscoffensis]|uniref:small ribosomal subunit protein eS19A-like n=1 Tax=Symsagittifera roscoffensis TaxID=84072 RepID=UPI00307C7BB8
MVSSSFKGRNTATLACDVDQGQLVKVVAQFLKKGGKVQSPAHHDFAKTSHGKELPPRNPDWFLHRMASILRHLYYRKTIGVGAFRRVYGGRKNYGSAREHTVLGGQGVIRRGLQQLEALGYVEKHEDGGRKITSSGCKVLDRMAVQIDKAPQQ